MAKKTGGPAFPHPAGDNLHEKYWYSEDDGMTLRDYFAGQALAGLLAHHGSHKLSAHGTDGTCAATVAFEMADAMLAEKDKE